jgi:MYXO-CTERM domain-containing protein
MPAMPSLRLIVTKAVFASALAPSLVIALLASCVAERKPEPLAGNLLAGKKVETSGIPATDRLTDGRGAQEGDFWDTVLTARFDRPDAHVTWDLGAPSPLRCALIQGDNNDDYRLQTSDDGKEWKPLWVAGPTGNAGMRLRQGTFEATGRYVRLSASGGDSSYSVGEIAVFAECPAGWPKFDVPRADAVSPESASDASGSVWTVSLGLFALALVVFILLTRRRSTPPTLDPPPPPAGDEPQG